MPERFEIYIVYKRRYINTLPFLSFPRPTLNFLYALTFYRPYVSFIKHKLESLQFTNTK